MSKHRYVFRRHTTPSLENDDDKNVTGRKNDDEVAVVVVIIINGNNKTRVLRVLFLCTEGHYGCCCGHLLGNGFLFLLFPSFRVCVEKVLKNFQKNVQNFFLLFFVLGFNVSRVLKKKKKKRRTQNETPLFFVVLSKKLTRGGGDFDERRERRILFRETTTTTPRSLSLFVCLLVVVSFLSSKSSP